MAIVPMPTEEEAAAIQRLGFKPDTAYMEVPRCDACRHWERIGRRRVGDVGVGLCSKITFGVPSNTRPAACDTPSSLETRGDFGCVLWEAKA